jgi:hypothetical protein
VRRATRSCMKPDHSNRVIRVALSSNVGAASIAFVGATAATADTSAAGGFEQSAVIVTKNVNDWG